MAIAAAGSGPVDERLRVGIRQDLGLIVGRDWAVDHGQAVPPMPAAGPAAEGAARHAASADETPTLETAFAAAANAGLDVRMTATSPCSDCSGRAVRPPSTRRSPSASSTWPAAGVAEAELALGLGSGEVTVAVMDSGVGFDERRCRGPDRAAHVDPGAHRAGGRHVRLWSTKGIGTTVVLTVPEGGE